MGIFKDLGFKNRNNKLVAPDSERFGGFTLQEIVDSTVPKFINIDNTLDGQAIIQGTSLPTTILHAANWSEYQAVAYNLQDIVVSDSNTSLLLNGNDLTDKTGKVLTNNAVTIDTNIKKFGTGSLKFNGTNSLTTPGFTDLALGTGDFTIECWGYLTSYSNTASQYFFALDTTGGIGFGFESGYFCLGTRATAFEINYAYTPTLNTWTHYAVSRQSGTMRLFINGVLMLSKTNTKNFTVNTGTFNIGKIVTGTGLDGIVGNVADLRISKGLARYTSDFTPSTTELIYSVTTPKKLLINNVEQNVQSSSIVNKSTSTKLDIFKDGSCKAAYTFDASNVSDLSGLYNGIATGVTYTAGKFGNAINFPATNTDKVQMNSTILGATNYSISIWYKTSVKAWSTLFTTTNTGWSGTGIMFFTDATNVVVTHSNGAGTNNGYAQTPILNDGLWHHYVAVRNGSTIKLYQDGVLKSTVTLTSNIYTHSYNAYFGGYNDGAAGRTPGAKSMDQLRVFNRALTDAEVVTLFNETESVSKTVFDSVLTTESQMSVDLQGTVDTVEINYYEGV